MVAGTMTDPIRIFVGTDERQAPAEQALERSIRENTRREVEITWMRSGDPGWGEEGNRGRPLSEYRPKSGHGWGTYFSCFRLAIPSLCDYQGRAIYLDSDMIVLGDIAELHGQRLNGKAAVVNHRNIMDVMVLDCSHSAWRIATPIEEVKRSGHALGYWRRRLMKHGAFTPTLPPEWDCRDCLPSNCKLLHFTSMPTQPWKPWPEAMQYRPHPCKEAVEVWNRWASPQSA